MAAKKKPSSFIDRELRKWCIEEAMRWPTHTASYSSGMGISGPSVTTDADVIGRAQKIESWILGK